MSRGLVFGDHGAQVAHQGEVFGLDDPALGKLGQGASDDLDGRRPFQGDPRHPLARLRELSPEPTSRPTFTLRLPMPVTKQSPMPGISSSRRSEEHTSELQSRQYLVCRLLLEK